MEFSFGQWMLLYSALGSLVSLVLSATYEDFEFEYPEQALFFYQGDSEVVAPGVFFFPKMGTSTVFESAAAGFLRMPFRRWMLLDYIGVSIWVFTYMSAGYLMGAIFNLSLDDSTRNVRIFEAILFAFFIIALISIMRTTRVRQIRIGHDEDDEADDAADSTTA